MKLSARNQLKGTIVEVTKGQTTLEAMDSIPGMRARASRSRIADERTPAAREEIGGLIRATIRTSRATVEGHAWCCCY